MNRIILLLVVYLSTFATSHGQAPNEKIMYVVDSIPVIDDPKDDNEISQDDLATISVIRNKDSLKTLGYDEFDGVIYIFTKEYTQRPDSVKLIPSSKIMKEKNGILFFHNNPYTGKFIDYYYSGRKQEQGEMIDGKINGAYKIYYQNGNLIVERNYLNGVANGTEKEYFEDGSLKQKGDFVNGKEEGFWDMYFPNGQLKQRSNFKNGAMDGETTIYYSTGKILAVETTKNGKTTPDKRLDKVYELMKRGNEKNSDEDYKNAIKNYSKVIEIDSTYAEAYFARGTSKFNEQKFDEAIEDYDKALTFEPFLKEALANRAFARIRKNESGGREILRNDEVSIIATKGNQKIPGNDLSKICADLRLAILLGDPNKSLTAILNKYCGAQSSH